MITGAGKELREGDVVLHNLTAAGLPGASIVRAMKIATVEPSRILKRAGSLAPTERVAVVKAIAGFLAKAGG